MNISALEAVLFAAGDPVTREKLALAFETAEADIDDAVAALNARYEQSGSALQVLYLNNSVQLCTKTEFAAQIKKALEIKKDTPLSPAALEVLSIIAYNKKVTKGYIEQIRGVDSSSVVNSLAEKGLVEEAGRFDLPGRPIAYKTTEHFLRCFGLSSLDMLPQVPEQSGQLSLDEIALETVQQDGES